MRPLCLAMLACCLLPLMSPAAVAADDSPPVDQPKPATAAVGDGTGAAARRRQPNVVVILADDAGWGDFSVTGNQTLATPAVDSLAADGCLLETFFVQPVCAPTRAELLTGRWHPRGGVRGVTEGAERLSPDERTIAEVFRDGGYATGCFGKWHNGTQWPYHPLARGFERFYGFTEGHWGSYFDPPMESDSEFVRGSGYITDDITDKAIGFVRTHDGSPFLCYVAYNTPHSPMTVPDSDWDRFRERPLAQTHDKEDPTFTRAALAMVENLDANVGRLLAALDDCGIADDTIVVFFSDNGPNSFRWCGGMRGRKGSTDDGGVRSVCCLRWPGSIPAGHKIAEPTAAIDLLPTLAGLTGLSTAGCRPLDGVNLAPLLTQKGNMGSLIETLSERPIISSFRGRVSIRTATHRLDNEGRLYDMQADLGQTTDISTRQPEVAARLKALAAAYRRDVLSAVPTPTVERFPVGFPSAPQTELPARDGQVHGGVERSGRAPNCSFFTSWTSADDSITWTVDVLTPGRYEAELWYTCRAADTGATVELTCDHDGTAAAASPQTSAVITTAWDPPLNTGEDRVDRGSESYDKPFKPLALGQIDLPRGDATLTLRAPTIPGSSVADVRRLVLRPVQPGGD
jgi:arylsulfatase A-like enzyme